MTNRGLCTCQKRVYTHVYTHVYTLVRAKFRYQKAILRVDVLKLLLQLGEAWLMCIRML